jgi:hypothetical protein
LEGRKEYPYNYGNFFELEADHFSMIKYWIGKQLTPVFVKWLPLYYI